ANSLAKLRNGLNIAGYARPLTGITGDGTPTAIPPASNYRYKDLAARAQELVASTSQVEDRYLASLEKRDAENYAQLLASQDMTVAAVQVSIAQQQADIAQQQVTVTAQQISRAETQSQTYGSWLSAGPNQYEQQQLNDLSGQQDYLQQAS